MTVLLGAAGGGFAAAPFSPLAVGGAPLQLEAVDLDGDLRTDLAVPNNADGTVSILLQRRGRAGPDPAGWSGHVLPVLVGATFAGPPSTSAPGIVRAPAACCFCNPELDQRARPAVLEDEWIIATDFRPSA